MWLWHLHLDFHLLYSTEWYLIPITVKIDTEQAGFPEILVIIYQTKDGDIINLVSLTLSQATKALRESRGIALLYFRLCTRRGWAVSVTPRQHLTPVKDPVPIVQEAEWASGPVWTGAENLAPPGFDLRTVQPIGSRYTDYATRPTHY